MEMLNLGKFKEVIVSYGMHLSFVKQILNLWSTCSRHRHIPRGWRDLVKVICSLVFNYNGCPGGKKDKTIEQQNRARGMKIS